MKRLALFLFGAIVFCCGYLLGQVGAPIFPVKTAEAVQGPIPINCKVQVDSIRCYNETYYKVAHISISLSEGQFRDYQAKTWGNSTNKTIELTYE